MTLEPQAPVLTAITTVDAQRERGEIALRALLVQDLLPHMEILVVQRGPSDSPPLESSRHPSVRVIRVDRDCKYGEALEAGVREARAPAVAFIEEHVQVLPGWAAALAEAHREPWAAVCAEMYPGDLGRPEAIRIELLSRSFWSAPARPGEAAILRWQNVSYKRDVLLRYGNRLARFLQSEGALFRQLRRDGERLCIEPRAKIVHAHERSWNAFLHGTWHSTRSSTATALELHGGGWEGRWKPLAGALLGPVRWPAVLYRRTQQLPDARRWTGVFWRHLPYILEYYAMSAAATAAGIALGAGDSPSRFLDLEVNAERLVPNVEDIAVESPNGR